MKIIKKTAVLTILATHTTLFWKNAVSHCLVGAILISFEIGEEGYNKNWGEDEEEYVESPLEASAGALRYGEEKYLWCRKNPWPKAQGVHHCTFGTEPGDLF